MGIVPLRGKTLKVESTRGRSRDILAEKEGNLKAEDQTISLNRKAMHEVEDQRKVVCFLQPNFTDVLKSDDTGGKRFAVTVFDDCDTIHVRVLCGEKSSKSAESEKRVAFKKFQELPRCDEVSTVASDLISTLPPLDEPQIAILVSEDDHIRACVRSKANEPIEVAAVLRQPRKAQLYSRSHGILESSLLEDRKVAVVGLGSGGSQVVIELAKAGVGKFVLVDFDRIELHNIIRHVCGLTDLGRLKTNVMRDRVLDKNPFAEVETHNTSINNLEDARRILKGCDLIIAATDNIRSRLNINALSIELGIATLYGKCAVRAAGGEVLRVRPKVGPCFSCIYAAASLEAVQEETSSFRQAREANPPYVGDDEVKATIQVGLSSDINPISNMLVKLALVELCRGKDSALKTLETDLQASYYMWANRREQLYASYPKEGFHRFDKPSILRWYPLMKERDPECKACQELNVSDENAGFFAGN